MFEDVPPILSGLKHLRHKRHEVVLWNILDQAEVTFPFQESTLFRGMEQYPELLTDPRSLRKSYLEQVDAFQKKVREGCERNQAHYVLVNTSQPWHEVLSSYLTFRKRTVETSEPARS